MTTNRGVRGTCGRPSANCGCTRKANESASLASPARLARLEMLVMLAMSAMLARPARLELDTDLQ